MIFSLITHNDKFRHSKNPKAKHTEGNLKKLRTMKQTIVTLDMESVLTPEIWIARRQKVQPRRFVEIDQERVVGLAAFIGPYWRLPGSGGPGSSVNNSG